MKTIDEMTLGEQLALVKAFDLLPDRVKEFVWEEMKDFFECYMEMGLFRFTLGVASHVAFLEKCESPIEQLMCLALDRKLMRHPYVLNVTSQNKMELEGKKYRADFVIEFQKDAEAPINKVIIECDGHDFHERTKEQAQRDKQRDRDLQAAGYAVLRFTGSEIYRDPIKCAVEVGRYITSVVGAQL